MLRLFAACVMTCTALTSNAMAQSANPGWVEDLEWQLGVEQQCEVLDYLNTHEGKLAGRDVFTAKVKCKDGRMFDAHKMEPEEKFTIKTCEVVTC